MTSNSQQETAEGLNTLDARSLAAQARIDEADAANQSALDALSAFMREIVSARRVLQASDAPSRALVRARDSIRENAP